MMDRLFSAALAFAVLAGGTAAIGSDLLTTRGSVPTMRIVQLERVVVAGRRVSASAPLARADGLQPVTQRVQ